jgi:alginate O-acetyltransferase complex protein AlgI
VLFNSARFLFVFLPLAWLGYALVARHRPSWSTVFLVLASLVFYGAWDVSAVPLLVGSFSANFVAARWLVGRPGPRRRLWLGLSIAANLAVLGYFKYANFAVRVIEDASGRDLAWQQVVLPLGISFFTFQQIAYLVDCARAAQTVEPSFARYALFSTFFAQHIAGPIVHHDEMMPQFAQPRASRLRDVSEGATLLLIGLLKKLLLADGVAAGASAVFDAAASGRSPSLLEAWLAALAYAFQIYFDFSAYSDMAIGIGRMFGIDLPINFASPYKAASIAEFWRRWHITLSRFLRDYLYIPLGGNRRGPARQKLHLMLTMALGGLWHGAEWTFVVWGALHGLFLIINHGWRASGWGTALLDTRLGRASSQALTLLCVVIAWVPFRAADMATSGRIWAGMLGQHGLLSQDGLAGATPILGFDISAGLWLVACLAIALGAPNSHEIMARARLGLPSRGYPDPAAHPAPTPFAWKPSLPTAMVMGVAFAVILLELNDVSEFIYFQF